MFTSRALSIICLLLLYISSRLNYFDLTTWIIKHLDIDLTLVLVLNLLNGIHDLSESVLAFRVSDALLVLQGIWLRLILHPQLILIHVIIINQHVSKIFLPCPTSWPRLIMLFHFFEKTGVIVKDNLLLRWEDTRRWLVFLVQECLVDWTVRDFEASLEELAPILAL